MVRAAQLVLAVLCVALVAAVCTPQQAQEYLSQDTDYAFSEVEQIDYALVIDRSGSMRAGNRFSEAKAAAGLFVEQLARQDRAAVIGFDSRAQRYSSFTDDTAALTRAISRMSIGDFTQYQAGLSLALEEFSSSSSSADKKIAVLMSDGKPDDDEQVLSDTVDSLLARDICIYTIAYAEEANEQAQRVLQGISQKSQEQTGCGAYFRAEEDSYDLRRIYSQIYDETASEDVLDVSVQVSTEAQVSLQADVSSALNDQPVLGRACFSPEIEFVILRDEKLVFEQRSHQAVAQTLLPAGEYSFVVSARETCGGECSFSGSTQGSFSVSSEDAVCTAPFEQISTMLRSTQDVKVAITPEGFKPRTVGTDGVVTWVNEDSVAHRVVGVDGSFRSPSLRPGDSWTYAFGPGEHAYVDASEALRGAVHSQPSGEDGGLDLVVVLDRSGSMAGAPLREAKAAANGLLSLLGPADRASLVAFSDKGQVYSPLTSNVEGLREAVDGLLSSGATNYVSALELVPQVLRGSDREQVVLFLSDGAPTDSGGPDAVMDALASSLGDACLFTIGYGEEGVAAVQMLTRMADLAQQRNECGIFYYSSAQQESLSRVFGEVYALSKDAVLSFVDLEYPERPSQEFSVSTRLQSAYNGVWVPSSGAVCVPPATVTAVFGNQRFPLVFDGERYVGTVSLEEGEYNGVVTASLSARSGSSQTIAASAPLVVDVGGSRTSWWLWAAGVALVLAWAKVFIDKRRRPGYEL